MVDLLDVALLQTTTLYAVALEASGNKERLEPDWIWLEVAIGSALCLTAASVRCRLEEGSGRAAERAAWRSFIVGGLPILAWQLWQAHTRHRALSEKASGDG